MKTTVAQFLLTGLMVGPLMTGAYAADPMMQQPAQPMTLPGQSLSTPMSSPATTPDALQATPDTALEAPSEMTPPTAMTATPGTFAPTTGMTPIANPTGEAPATTANDSSDSKNNLEVKTDEDKVSIKGHIDSLASFQQAVAGAQAASPAPNKVVSDVTVHNRLDDLATPWAGEKLKLTTSGAVKARIASDDIMKGTMIHVRTRDNTIFLSGKVSSWEQYVAATQVASSEGPWKVVNRLKIQQP